MGIVRYLRIVDTPFDDGFEALLARVNLPMLERIASKYARTSFDRLADTITLHKALPRALDHHRGAAAFVFQQDRHAALALDYLSTCRIRVPREFSAKYTVP